ncbi:helix-turn-helix domain-containing protein [Paenibacillus polymyxa]|uniref:helix-turn-helix domain-containing protein n=1 Tax=Paenibacillus polymyxa TaxID=1406 RepID=UPI0025B65B56|nr:helix-turn-helix domain-containing protein [Paenibacillus polymyxa]MDN4080864.1 helix-turn-helix domain-containing protein [Paenibacillus polymyxa]MDN4106501.1 helix-turn-helix domain-containing protein [Paenibacillus polymyxa]MDN4116504.1 helix-turn-helix domain-containing protein [Paenibacillus polymyxa]
MNIHKNTLLYRVNKIKKLLNSSLDEGDELFSYQLSFKILIICPRSCSLIFPNYKTRYFMKIC